MDMQGFNGAIIAYGQTGSGKTHTMLHVSMEHGAFFKSWKIGMVKQEGFNHHTFC